MQFLCNQKNRTYLIDSALQNALSKMGFYFLYKTPLNSLFTMFNIFIITFSFISSRTLLDWTAITRVTNSPTVDKLEKQSGINRRREGISNKTWCCQVHDGLMKTPGRRLSFTPICSVVKCLRFGDNHAYTYRYLFFLFFPYTVTSNQKIVKIVTVSSVILAKHLLQQIKIYFNDTCPKILLFPENIVVHLMQMKFGTELDQIMFNYVRNKN